MAVVSQILLFFAGIFLIIVVLLQRGRGGGLAGAFGGMGGQSAFGTKAGDVFTRITIGIAIIWVALAGGSGFFLRASSEQKGGEFAGNEVITEDGAGAFSGDGELDIPTAPQIEDPPETDATDGESALPATNDSAAPENGEPEEAATPPTEESTGSSASGDQATPPETPDEESPDSPALTPEPSDESPSEE
jgi:preprotein translocase subunit SecG